MLFNSYELGIIHDDLKTFLEANVPTGKKKSKVLLGVGDSKLGAAIQETVDIHCESGGLVLEVLRGIRFHFEKMIKGLTGPMAAKAQLGLGHSYSRAKVKFNVHRVDNMIIQSISLLDQLDKDINTFSMRIRYIQYLFLFWVCILWLYYAAYRVKQIMQVHLWAEALSGFVLYDQISVPLIFCKCI